MIVFEHEKLGVITFKKDKDGRPVYNNEKVREIFIKGIESLVNQDLLTQKDREMFKDIVNNMEIGIKKNLPARISIPCQYNRRTGKVVSISFYIGEISLYIPIKDMVESILSSLCKIIVMYKFPKDKVREYEKYGSDDGLNGYGGYWIRYAEALLPEDYITHYKIAYNARDYILKNAVTEHIRVFSNELGEGWASELAEEYAGRLIDEELTEKDYPLKDFMEEKYEELNDNEDEDGENCNIQDSPQPDSPISSAEYIKNMKEKYKDELDTIGEDLVMVSSYQRGAALFDTIASCKHEELKYYLLIEYWDWIDKGQELYTPSLVSRWLNAANVQLDLSGIEFDNDGFVTVYRGENEYSLPWEKGALSWTTSRKIAEKFSKGVRVRIQTAAQPKVIIGKVHRDNILARIDSRDEFELLCKDVVFLEEIKLKSNNKDGGKKAKLPSYVQE